MCVKGYTFYFLYFEILFHKIVIFKHDKFVIVILNELLKCAFRTATISLFDQSYAIFFITIYKYKTIGHFQPTCRNIKMV